jgi:uncharacterized protein (TIGR02246 family)
MAALDRWIALTPLVLLTLSACSSAPQPPAEESAASAEAAFEAIWTEYSDAAKAGDVDRLAALFTDSIYFTETGAPTLRTREALVSYGREALAAVRILDMSIRPEFTEVRGSDVAQYGNYVDVIEVPGQGTIRKYGRYAAIAQRDSTGAWRIARLTALADSMPALADSMGR